MNVEQALVCLPSVRWNSYLCRFCLAYFCILALFPCRARSCLNVSNSYSCHANICLICHMLKEYQLVNFIFFLIRIIYLNDLFEGADFQTKHIHFYTNYRRGSFVGVQINRTRFVYISGRSCVTGRLEETFFHKIFYSQRAWTSK